MKKVLIIGGCGFIGTAITYKLSRENYKVGVYDINADNTYSTSSIEYYSGDVLEDDKLPDIIAQYDVIIYLLSSIMPEESMSKPNVIYSTDISMLLRVLELCNKFGIKRVIYSSSGGAIYGEHTLPNKEDETITNPQNHYAICKLTCEKILLLYNKLYSMENVILRIANPYGINQHVSSGVGAISNFVYKILNDQHINIYGDGEIIRDYIPVEDVAGAFFKVIEWNCDYSVLPIFNVGSGEGISLNQAIAIIARTLNKSPLIDYIKPRDFDLAISILDMTKTEKHLGRIKTKDSKDAIKDFCYKMKEYWDLNK